MQNRLKAVEREIADYEQKIADWDHELLMNYEQAVADPKFLERYNATKEALESSMDKWQKVSEELEAFETS